MKSIFLTEPLSTKPETGAQPTIPSPPETPAEKLSQSPKSSNLEFKRIIVNPRHPRPPHGIATNVTFDLTLWKTSLIPAEGGKE